MEAAKAARNRARQRAAAGLKAATGLSAAAAIVAGTALAYWPAALIVAGAMGLALLWDLSRPAS